LRGAVGSADGTYENTLQGFFAWVMASQYFTFLTSNPFQVSRDAAFYWTLFQNQFGILGLALAAIGVIWLARKPREWALLIVALIAEAGFAFNYHVANVYVHFLTTFLLLALFAGAGADALLTVFTQVTSRNSKLVFAPLLVGLLLLLIPVDLLLSNYTTNDLSTKWDMHDYGLDVLNQPLGKNATIIGIQGEMTLIRYLQGSRGIHPDVQTIAADTEPARLAAIDSALQQNRVVYLTRPLKDAEKKYSLSSLGPLIRVNPQPGAGGKNAQLVGDDFGEGIRLLGYEIDAARLNAIPNLWHAENGRFLRVTLHWLAPDKIDSDAMVSVKVLRKDHRVVGQIDHRPVLDAYPTTAWRAAEVIADTYAVPLLLGITPSDYTVQVTMYDADSGRVIGQRDLDQISLRADGTAPRRDVRNPVHASDEYFALSLAGYGGDVWSIAHTVGADFGALSLIGYSLDLGEHASVRPGDALPLTLLWRAGATKLPDDLSIKIWLEDSEGKTVASRDAPISIGYPPFQWLADSYVRDWPTLHVPANVADGAYGLKLAVARDNQLLGSALLPFNATIVDLGRIGIKNRPRVTVAPAIPHSLEATFDNTIKLWGYDLKMDSQSRKVQVTLYWKALAQMDTSYTVFVHLLDAKNNVLASGDAVPGNGGFPTTGWIDEEYITDVHPLSILPETPAGAYRIEIGLYDPATGTRLKTADGQDRVLLTSVNVP